MGLFKSKEERWADKIRRVEDDIADLQYARETWSFAWSPSRKRAAEERIAELEQKLEELNG